MKIVRFSVLDPHRFKVNLNNKAKHVANFALKWFHNDGPSQLSKKIEAPELAFSLNPLFVLKWVHIQGWTHVDTNFDKNCNEVFHCA